MSATGAQNIHHSNMPSVTETSPLLGSRTPSLGSPVALPMADLSSEPSLPESQAARIEASMEAERKALIYGCCVATLFFFVELIGGYLAHSLAIMSDAAHMLSDVAGMAISLIAISVSRLPANSRLTFGFARAEVLGAFVSVFLIWALTAVLVIFAIYRLFHPEPVNGRLMLLLGTIGLGVNLILGFVLGHSHSHSHAHSHSHEQAHPSSHSHLHFHAHVPSNTSSQDIENKIDQGELHQHTDSDHTTPPSHDEAKMPSCPAAKFSLRSLLFGTDIQSVNVRAAYLHVLGDALQSIGVIIAAVVICINPNLSFVDPLCTLLFASLVIMTTAGLARDTIAVLMEATPPSIKLDEIYRRLSRISGVRRVGDLHVWSISTHRPALSVHLYQKANVTAHDVLKETRRILAAEFSISHATVQINCEATSCCDEKVYLGSRSHEKTCVTYSNVESVTPSSPIPNPTNLSGSLSDQASV